jgi:hypothetical protein
MYISATHNATITQRAGLTVSKTSESVGEGTSNATIMQSTENQASVTQSKVTAPFRAR